MSVDAGAVRIPVWARDVLSPALANETTVAEPFMRTPDEVMSPEALRSMTATRLSFARTLVARMVSSHWSIELRHSDVAADGTGFLAYEILAEGHRMHFGVFAYPPLPIGHQRLFRDTKTDFFAALIDGPLDIARLQRERAEFDKNLWRGRTDPKVYGWTIASRGTRTFNDVVEALANGSQPDREELDRNGGYILRNGGFYGNGRMGTRAWQSYAKSGGPLSMPYHVDLFCLYLWRQVSFDLVNAAAKARNPVAQSLAPDLKRCLGVGNSSGLGTVAALVRWPARLSAYILTREIAFAYVKSRPAPIGERLREELEALLTDAASAYSNAPDAAPELLENRQDVSEALRRIAGDVKNLEQDGTGPRDPYPWNWLTRKAQDYGSREATELLHSLLLELYPEVSEFSQITVAGMARPCAVDPAMTVQDLRKTIEEHFAWMLKLDLDTPGSREYFWYRSEENGENRRGERSVDVGVERETFIDVAGIVRRLYDFAAIHPNEMTVARFLLENPEHALGVSRVQLASTSPFSEIRTSVCSSDFLPSQGIRCFLTILGLELPAPHSARWVRGVFYRGTPLPEDIATRTEDASSRPLPAGTDEATDVDAMART